MMMSSQSMKWSMVADFQSVRNAALKWRENVLLDACQFVTIIADLSKRKLFIGGCKESENCSSKCWITFRARTCLFSAFLCTTDHLAGISSNTGASGMSSKTNNERDRMRVLEQVAWAQGNNDQRWMLPQGTKSFKKAAGLSDLIITSVTDEM